MSDTEFGTEKRQHKRVGANNKQVRARRRNADDAGALLRDLSLGGAALGFEDDFDPDEMLALDIDDVGVLSAEYARDLDDGIAVRFIDIEDQDEEMLMAELSRLDADWRGGED